MSALRTVVRLTLLSLAFSCARTDLGAPCHLQDALGAEVQPQPGREYLYLGSSECESFACLAARGSSGAYCSQACTGAAAVTCPKGMVCGQLSLSETYLDDMKARLPPARYAQLFGQLNSSWYCVKSTR
jgi:hypothetical protein